ncbi:unnamed protein product [Arctia plantaginis]|uniref:C2H2-type domain-containing protein n=1 Tax=Arctia plantaginis TaxID=874455 RepID=A0A8S1AZ15_ARCPL|nr:unnamed protein product [Arctia plantaginis]
MPYAYEYVSSRPWKMNQGMDLDPLSTYEYPSYDSYHSLNNTQTNHLPPYPYQHVKQEETYYNQPIQNNTDYTTNNTPQTIPQNEPVPQVNKPEQPNEENEVKPDVTKKKKDKKNGRNYCSQKINDATYPFYGCSVCNISYTALHELDQHVTVHKNRMTSYRLRLRNQYKKKQIKKEKRKLKKLKKIKVETETEIEIKPEDGYIGNEKTKDYVNNEQNDIVTDKDENNSVSKDLSKVDDNNGAVSSQESCESKDKDADDTELNNLEKIYKCFACKKQFTLSYYLKLHVRSHTDEKPYKCSMCGQSFITASKLGRHNKRIHLAARFQCRICFKIFSRFELLTNHFDKSHPEDKLEGEPYDYNAILPYLKELEEQLKEQAEAKEQKKDDSWFEVAVAPETDEVKKEDQEDDEKLIPKIDIIVEELKVDSFDDVKVKEEIEDDESENKPADELPGDDFRNDDENDDVKNEDFKDDSPSDDDYFPSNTWASTPKCDPSPPPSPKPRKTAALKTNTCEICNKEISSASYMRVHMRTHTGEKPFKCYTCGRGFITSSKMNRHVLTHGNDAKEEEIKQEDAEVKEEEEAPTEDDSSGLIKKKKKKRKLTKASAKEEKVRKKHQKRPHSCEYCNQKFLHLKMLEVHKKCHEGEELVLKCQFCLEEAIDSAALKEHEATHSGPKPYLCTICGKTYKKRETMVYHRKQHAPSKEYVCDVCSKRFGAACKLAKHLATHRAGGFVLRYECPVCAHMFNTRYHVQMHLATHQKEGLILESNRNEVLAMVLQNALKIPKQPDAASTLTDITPSDERYRICKICGETFHHFYYLEEHLKSHGSKIAIDDTNKAEEKKYICEICHKGFKLHYYLKLHSFTHSKEKPFMCQQCGKGFITKGKLKRHLETHSGLKKYQCHICYKFFTRPSYLRIHIRTIHGTQDYNYRFDKSLTLSAISALAHISDRQNTA